MSQATPPGAAGAPSTPRQGAGPDWEQLIGRIDRRLVYLGLFLITLVPLVLRFSLPLYVTPPAQAFYDTIQSLPADRLVMVASDWEAGSQAESRPQMYALIRHLIRRNLKFAVITVSSPPSVQFAQSEVERAIRDEGAEARWKYGEQWVNLGFKNAVDPWMRAFSQDIGGAVKADWHDTPVAQIPVMRDVHRFGPDGQVSMLIDVTAVTSVDAWYQFLTPTRVKLGIACTAVMAPAQYAFLDSGQLSGLLTGMKGAAEYEKLLGIQGFGTSAMAGQSFAHLYILILIVLGNTAVILGWRRRGAR